MAANSGGASGPGHHHDLGGPGEGRGHPDHPADLALGLGHVGVARAGDHVDPGHGGGAVGHGGDGLGPADPVHLVDPGDGGRGQGGVVDPSVGGRRHAEHDVLDAGHPGRGGAHEDGGGVSSPAARRVEAGPSHGASQVVHGHPTGLERARRRPFVGVVRLDALVGQLEGVLDLDRAPASAPPSLRPAGRAGRRRRRPPTGRRRRRTP